MIRKMAQKRKMVKALERKQPILKVGRYKLVACWYCHKLFRRRHLTLDHVVQRRLNGGFTVENIVLCCSPCNTRREVTHTPKNTRYLRKLSLLSLTQSVRLLQ